MKIHPVSAGLAATIPKKGNGWEESLCISKQRMLGNPADVV